MAKWLSKSMSWIYPGSPSCNSNTEYSDGRVTHFLKPEYYRVDSNGDLEQVTVAADGCNAYSVANAADIRKNCDKAYFTISGSYSSIFTLVGDSGKETTAINTIKTFLTTTGFDGIELDWEGFGSWTAQEYSDYKSFVDTLGTSLALVGKKLMIDGPPIGDATEQGYYEWKYEDFESLAVDYIVALAYDWQYDFGAGTSISPTSRVNNVCDWMKGKITNIDRIVIGLPSYGYHGVTAGYTIIIDTKTESEAFTGYGTATRNSDHEMNWTNGGSSYFYNDATGISSKRDIVEAKGIKFVSVWHLGGNDGFTGKDEQSITKGFINNTSKSLGVNII